MNMLLKIYNKGRIILCLTCAIFFNCSKVKNDVVYSKGFIPDVSNIKVLIVPDNIKEINESNTHFFIIYSKKILDFYGYPPNKINIDIADKYMGCAYKKENNTLIVATYGEWMSKEGGAFIELKIEVPKGIIVKKKTNLSGRKSIAVSNDYYEHRSKKDYWYTHTEPMSDWHKIEICNDSDIKKW